MCDYLWKREGNTLYPVWDAEQNIQNIIQKVKVLTTGCKCKKGCKGRCGCRRAGRECGPGCSCIHCTNRMKGSGTVNEIVAQVQES